MDRVLRLREPATVVALIGLAVLPVLVLAYGLAGPGPFPALVYGLGATVANPILIAVVAGLAASCWIPAATPHARGLTVLSLVVVALLLVAVVVIAVARQLSPDAAPGNLFATLLTLVPPLTVAVLALGLLGALVGRPVAPAPTELPAAEPAPEPVDPQLQPTWTTETAVGTVWRRAGDAASQTPAISWEAPGQTGDGGWGRGPTAEPPNDPARRTEP